MDSYELRWKNSAERDLRNISPQAVPRIIKSIELLTNNPFPSQCRKLWGSEQEYRIRVGDFRVIYEVDSRSKVITIYHVRHRKEAYRK